MVIQEIHLIASVSASKMVCAISVLLGRIIMPIIMRKYDIAMAFLRYMHSSCSLCIVHRDAACQLAQQILDPTIPTCFFNLFDCFLFMLATFFPRAELQQEYQATVPY